MPKKKNYPKWFSQYSKPYPPTKPQEFLTKEKVLGTSNNNHEFIRLDSLPEGTVSIYIEAIAYDEYGGPFAEVTVTYYGEPKQIPNPNYKKLLKNYEQAYEEYKENLLEWTTQKIKWDKEAKEESEIFEKKQYEKLKKKFEKDDYTGIYAPGTK